MKKLRSTMLKMLSEGLEPSKLALAAAAGITLGIFPIYGPISLACLGIAWIARLNLATILAAYYSMVFVKPVLILPFLRLGETLFRSEPMPISLVDLSARFARDALGTLSEFGWSFVHAMAGWLAAVPVVAFGVYFFSHGVLTRVQTAKRQEG